MYYLKYRPRKFSEVVGLDGIIQTLQKTLVKKTVPHAYLFAGPRGSGKTTTARLLAKALNCENPLRGDFGLEVCDECGKCQSIAEGRFLDLIEIDAASNRGIDDIRSLREKVKLAPSSGGFKVYIIDEVHMLTAEAFNALLKTLEEPPAHAVFILATTEAQKIPETIKSRCQFFNFKRADRKDLLLKLKRILSAEEVKVDEKKLEEIVRAADGGFRDAETLLEQTVSGFTDLKTGLVEPPFLVDFLVAGDRAGALYFIDDLYKRGVDLGNFSQNLLYYFRDMILMKSGIRGEDLSYGADSLEKIVAHIRFLSEEDLRRLTSLFLKAWQDLKNSPIPQLPLEMAVISFLSDRRGPNSPEADKHRSSEHQSSGKDFGNAERREDGEERIREPSGGGGKEFLFSLEEIKEKWPLILKEVKPENHSLEALLRSARPKDVSVDLLTLEVFYKFHKEKLSSRQNLDILERVFSKVLGKSVKVNCVLGESRPEKGSEVQEKKSVSDDEIKAAALEAFNDE